MRSTETALGSLVASVMVSIVLLTSSVLGLPRALREKSGRRPRRAQKPTPTRTARPLSGNAVLWLDYGRNPVWRMQGLVLAALGGWVLWAFTRRWFDAFDAMYYIGVTFAYAMIFLVVLFGARSFAGGKRDGSLELLLSTPLSNEAIVRGKLLAALRHHGPYFVAACGLIVAGVIGDDSRGSFASVCDLAGVMVCAACVGMHVSAEAKSVTYATLHAVGTVAVLVLLVHVIAWMAGMLAAVGLHFFSAQPHLRRQVAEWFGVVVRLGLFVWLARRAYRYLCERLRLYLAA